ncbi:DUF6123 family protein [Falsibacillus pallidus]|uniref:Uncharacterized protein n=1 Tax=Falsibacillus pallidus TaxID=493781 RepID=A0A370GMD2_9BACI|nr:DUF6123 family protein [Falsibacillus pallidus]RDI43053.1 hypothetical protein DFR59_104104 [Falsibacillus pallidus]
MKKDLSLGEFLLDMKGRGFKFEQDAIGFIYFGQRSTDASDQLVKFAIEITLKTQKTFDGSFYISLLETLKENEINSRHKALQFVKDIGLLA